MSVDVALNVARLIAELGGVGGRKRLQKIVHLLRVAHPNEFQYRFTLHYFGPFSRGLAEDLDFLRASEVISEEEPADPDGAYKYSVSGNDILPLLREVTQRGNAEPPWVSYAKKLGHMETSALEALSTAIFMYKRGTDASNLRQQFSKIKPKLIGEFDRALRLGRELGLIQDKASRVRGRT